MTMTETRPPETGEEPTPCRVGCQTAHPCWREATEKQFPEDERLTLCAEHAREMRLGMEAEDWQGALCAIEEWMRGPVAEERSGHLEALAWKMRDEAREECARAAAAAYAAKLVAQQGPPEEGAPRLAREHSEKLARLIIRADSFVNARAALEDLPEDALREKWATIDALVEAAREANEEAGRYKEELGLRD